MRFFSQHANTFVPNFLSDKVDSERLFLEFQSNLVKVIFKLIVGILIIVW